MLRLLAIVLFSVVPVRAQVIVNDPVQTTIQKVNLELTTLHTQFMKLQMVQDAITLKNNYLAAKQQRPRSAAHGRQRHHRAQGRGGPHPRAGRP